MSEVNVEYLNPLLQAEPLTLALVLAIVLSLVLLELVSKKER
jgi:hypothetical protein